MYRCNTCGKIYKENLGTCPNCDIGYLDWVEDKHMGVQMVVGKTTKFAISLVVIIAIIVGINIYFSNKGSEKIMEPIIETPSVTENTIKADVTELDTSEIIESLGSFTYDDTFVDHITAEYTFHDVFLGEDVTKQVTLTGNMVDGLLTGYGEIYDNEIDTMYAGNFKNGKINGIMYVVTSDEEIAFHAKDGVITDTMLTAVLSAEYMHELEGIDLDGDTVNSLYQMSSLFSTAGTRKWSDTEYSYRKTFFKEDVDSLESDYQNEIIRLENMVIKNLWMQHEEEFWTANALEIIDDEGKILYILVDSDVTNLYDAVTNGDAIDIDAMFINKVKNYNGDEVYLMAGLNYKLH